MFIKRTIGGSKENPIVYYQLVHSERDRNGVPRHKVIMNIGREDQIKNNPSLIDNIIKTLSKLSSSLIVVDKDEEFLSYSYIYGPLLLIDKIWEDILSIPSIIKKEIIEKGKIKVRFDIERAIRLMVINRLISPMSKLAISRWKRYLWDPDNTYAKIKPQHLYRTLDILSSFKEEIETRLYEKTLSLFYSEIEDDKSEEKEIKKGKAQKGNIEEGKIKEEKIKEGKIKGRKTKKVESEEEKIDKKKIEGDKIKDNKTKDGKAKDCKTTEPNAKEPKVKEGYTNIDPDNINSINNTNNTGKTTIDIVFYDLTTTYFESVKEDTIRRFGYSKDNKTDCTQIVIALIITPDGIPIGYDIFPGNTYEGYTIDSMLKKLKERFNLKKVIVVGDKGILSNKVLAEIERYGYEYIVSAKLKSLPKRYHKEILNLENYHRVYPYFRIKRNQTQDNQENEKEPDILFTHEISIGTKRLILGYSEKRRKREERQREILLEKIRNTLSRHPNETFTKSSYKRYLTIETKGHTRIDEEKIEKQKIWDGFFGFYTNNKKLSAKEVVSIYRMLWKIEDRFRMLKSQLHLRPIYHWTRKRIEGHILICFLSLYISVFIEKRLEKSGIIDEIMEEIEDEEEVEETGKAGKIDEYLEGYSVSTVSYVMDKLKEISVIKINTLLGIIYSRMSMDNIHKNILKLFSVKIPPTILREIKEDDTKKKIRSKTRKKTKAKNETCTKPNTDTKTNTKTSPKAKSKTKTKAKTKNKSKNKDKKIENE